MTERVPEFENAMSVDLKLVKYLVYFSFLILSFSSFWFILEPVNLALLGIVCLLWFRVVLYFRRLHLDRIPSTLHDIPISVSIPGVIILMITLCLLPMTIFFDLGSLPKSFILNTALGLYSAFLAILLFLIHISNQDWLCVERKVYRVFMILLLFHLPVLLVTAKRADDMLNNRIPTTGDDHGYQIYTINLMHGIGWTSNVVLPLKTYSLDLTTEYGTELKNQYGNENYDTFNGMDYYDLYRTPGFPLMLAASYAIFGVDPLVARIMLALCAWITAILILHTGRALNHQYGLLAGSVAAVAFLQLFIFTGLVSLENILSEIPSVMWLTLFGLLLAHYAKNPRNSLLISTALALTVTIFVRPNLLLVVPFISLYILWLRRNLFEPILLAIIVGIPVIMWSFYISQATGHFVLMSTQGSKNFAEYNNIDVLEGIGPDRWRQGDWQPGYTVTEDGIIRTNQHAVKPWDSGWSKGLEFWSDHLSDLPRLFYVKLRKGFWSSNRSVGRIGLIGVGFLLFMLGLRRNAGKISLFRNVSSSGIIMLQVFWLILLGIFGSGIFFPIILLSLFMILLFSWLHPYSDVIDLNLRPLMWPLGYVAAHALHSILFGGSARFQFPYDPALLIMGIWGIIMICHILATSQLNLQFAISGTMQPISTKVAD